MSGRSVRGLVERVAEYLQWHVVGGVPERPEVLSEEGVAKLLGMSPEDYYRAGFDAGFDAGFEAGELDAERRYRPCPESGS